MNRKPRVLVIDDSAFARTVIARLLRADDIEVAGSAADGVEALESIDRLDPDVVTLDLTMPTLDGIGVLRSLRGRARPRVLVVSISSIDTAIGAEALALGAVDLIAKPTALATDRLNEIGDELVAKVRAAAESFVSDRIADPTAAVTPAHKAELVVVGTSTGGPAALTQLLAAMPEDFPVPLVMALHIPSGYTESLAERLDKTSRLHVVEAHDMIELRPGLAVLARGGMQLRIEKTERGLFARLGTDPALPYSPSVDELFRSAANALGAGVLGVILTGMGDDGLAGSRMIAEAGGALIAESSSTCVVYGMPRCVAEAGIGAAIVPLERIAQEVQRRV